MGIDKKSSLKKIPSNDLGGNVDDLYGAKKHVDDGGHIPAGDCTSAMTTMMRAAGHVDDIDQIGRFADIGNIAAI